jgi:hypothetical protein
MTLEHVRCLSTVESSADCEIVVIILTSKQSLHRYFDFHSKY